MNTLRQNNGNVETCVLFYQRADRCVSLISCVHIGEVDYFKTLEGIAQTHDVVLHEPMKRSKNGRLMAENLGLAYQSFVINYDHQPNIWRNAECTVEPNFLDRIYSFFIENTFLPVVKEYLDEKSDSKKEYVERVFSVAHSLPNQLIGLSFEPRRRAAIKTFESIEPEKTVAFFYGAGHIPFFEKYLKSKGYAKVGKKWVVAVRV